MTVQTLASQVPCSVNALNQWERGDFQPMHQRYWEGLANALGVSVGWLQTDHGYRIIPYDGHAYPRQGNRRYKVVIMPPELRAREQEAA